MWSAVPLVAQNVKQGADFTAVAGNHRRELVALGVGHTDAFDHDIGDFEKITAACDTPIDVNRCLRIGEKYTADNRNMLGRVGARSIDGFLIDWYGSFASPTWRTL